MRLPAHCAAAAAWLVLAAGPTVATAQQPAPRKAVILAYDLGDQHNFRAQAATLKACLEYCPEMAAVKAELHSDGWPADANTLNDADVIIALTDGCGAHPFFRTPRRAALIDRQMRRGCGLVVLHYAFAALPGTDANTMLRWLGGTYRENHTRIVGAQKAEVTPIDPNHPICRGWRKLWASGDEWYCPVWFGDGAKGGKVAPLATLAVPLAAPPRNETVAWTFERAGGGRSFAYTGGHSSAVWQEAAFRTMICNAILWTAKADLPAGGIESKLPPSLKAR